MASNGGKAVVEADCVLYLACRASTWSSVLTTHGGFIVPMR